MDDLKNAARMVLTLVDDPTDRVEVMFNPTEFEHAIQTNWSRKTVPGLGYQPKHYINTTNAAIPMELFYRAITEEDLTQMETTMNFFRSLCYPVETDSVISGGLPRVLVVWPGSKKALMSIIVTVNALGERFIKFNRFGDAVVARVRVEFEEIRSTRITSAQVRSNGLNRQDAIDYIAANRSGSTGGS